MTCPKDQEFALYFINYDAVRQSEFLHQADSHLQYLGVTWTEFSVMFAVWKISIKKESLGKYHSEAN